MVAFVCMWNHGRKPDQSHPPRAPKPQDEGEVSVTVGRQTAHCPRSFINQVPYFHFFIQEHSGDSSTQNNAIALKEGLSFELPDGNKLVLSIMRRCDFCKEG